MIELNQLKNYRNPNLAYPWFVNLILERTTVPAGAYWEGGVDIVLAGGAVRDLLYSVEPSDYDFFFVKRSSTAQETIENVLRSIDSEIIRSGGRKVFACPENKLITYKIGSKKVQFINKLGRPYDSIEHLMDTFDFHACQFVTNGWQTFTNKEAIRSVVKKVLTIHQITYPSSTINRIGKYKSKGFYVGEAISEVVETLGQMPPSIFEEVYSDDTLYID